jgi:DNA processing protein
MNKELKYLLALHSIEGIGGVTARSLISYCGSAEQVFKTNEAKLLRIPHVGEHIAQLIIKQDNMLEKAERELDLAEKNGVQIVAFMDTNYPTRLARLHDAPLLLYHKGTTNLNAHRTVAIVGTRQATEYGRSVTEEIVQGLKPYNVLIVSGLAYGIDIAAHRACLQYQVPTLGVMANGIDIVYPSQHLKVAQDMTHLGGIITENPFGTQPDSRRFPARNRIIAGLADAIIVVEAKEKGGALITANIANEYAKEVFAVPNHIRAVASLGCNKLIQRQQAHIYTQVSDVTNLMRWFADSENQNAPKQASWDFDEMELSDSERKILAYLQQNREAFLDDMAFQLAYPVGQVSADLLNLELAGMVKMLPGKKYVLN